MSTLVIRFSSVGDIVLCGGVTGALSPVTFVTKPQYRELAESLPGVTKVICPPDDPLPISAERIVDLHANFRSWRTTNAVKGPVYRVRRYDLRRRWRVWFKQGEPPPSVLSRYAQAANVDYPIKRWGKPTPGSNDTLALIPFSKHATKEWPIQRYAELGKRFNGPVLILGSGAEKERMTPLLKAIGPKAQALAVNGFSKIVDTIGDIQIAVGGDTGLLHLCAAYNKPVVVIFGPTTKRDGFWPDVERSAAVKLHCRPCSRFGGKQCPRGDHMCMQSLSIDAVWEQIVDIAQ